MQLRLLDSVLITIINHLNYSNHPNYYLFNALGRSYNSEFLNFNTLLCKQIALNCFKNRCYVIDVNIGTIVGPYFTLTQNLEYFTLNFLILTPSFRNVPIEKEIIKV